MIERTEHIDYRYYDYPAQIKDLRQKIGAVEVRFENGDSKLLSGAALNEDGSVFWEGNTYQKADVVKILRYSSDGSLAKLSK